VSCRAAPQPPASSPAAALNRLSRSFGSLPAVDDLTFDVAPGELFGIVGPDGAGKTTTLRMLAGVLPPTSGDAELLGVSVARSAERVKPRLGYMAQRFGLYHDLTVRENLRFHADIYEVPPDEVEARLQQLYRFSRLGEFEDRLAGQLSGGMKQKLALSCALVHQPDLLLLDEPTFGVDPISRRELWLILHRMVAQGLTVIMTTSYMDEAERCDRVALLDSGRIVALDRPARIQQRLAGRLVSVRSAEPRELRDVLRALPQTRRATLFGDAVHVILEDGVTPQSLAGALHSAGARFEEVSPVRPTLEDAFIDLVGG
jgi:ABC-2 type transport system ATP-binding protein